MSAADTNMSSERKVFMTFLIFVNVLGAETSRLVNRLSALETGADI